MDRIVSSEFVKKNKSNPVTAKQREILVDFISNRPEMYTGKFTPSYTKDKMKKYWSELTNILNSVPGGPAKEWQQWRKTWVDLKKNTKSKLSGERKHSAKTGGGPPLPPPGKSEDKSIDDKLLQIISPVSVSGNINIDESEVQFDFEDDAHMFKNTFTGPHVEFCETDEYEATEVTHMDDHNYFTGKEKLPGLFIPDSSNQLAKDIKNITPTTKKRVTKTTRLTESIRNNKRFLEISEENLKSEKQFREKKLEILQKDSECRKVYQENKLIILNNISQAAVAIAADIKMLREQTRGK